MEPAFSLTDLERKIITVIQHHNKRSQSTSLVELEIRLGHEEAKLQNIISDLIQREWIGINEGEWVVKRKLF